MMGSGKSTIGPLLARRSGRRYVDSDREIERRTGLTVADLFAERGEPAAREVEHQVLTAALADARPSVIGTGGGVVTRAAGREALRRRAFVVWLRAQPETLARRVGGGEGRPLLAGTDVLHTLGRLSRERRPLYEEVADVTIDVDVLAPEGVVSQALALGAPS
jgi:shikimate kinase